MVFKNIEELDRHGVQVMSPREIERLRKRFRDVNTKFTQFKKPEEDSKSFYYKRARLFITVLFSWLFELSEVIFKTNLVALNVTL